MNDTAPPNDTLKTILVFHIHDKEQSFTADFDLPETPSDEGPSIMTAQVFAEIRKELGFGTHYDKLTDISDLLQHPPLSFTPEEKITGEYAFLVNTREVWLEITNNLLEAKYLLAQSRAYKDVEELLLKKDPNGMSNEVLNIHLTKMNAFDGAVYRLAKIEDLFLLLLFVNFGNSLVDTNMESDDWQKRVVWNAVRDGLRKREPAVISNRYLNVVSDEDYAKIMSLFNKFKNPAEVGEITAYRDATTHRIRPAIDHAGTNASLIFPKIREIGAQVLRSGAAVPSRKVDFEFLDLYDKAASVFKHYSLVLRELKEVPRFS